MGQTFLEILRIGEFVVESEVFEERVDAANEPWHELNSQSHCFISLRLAVIKHRSNFHAFYYIFVAFFVFFFSIKPQRKKHLKDHKREPDTRTYWARTHEARNPKTTRNRPYHGFGSRWVGKHVLKYSVCMKIRCQIIFIKLRF